MVDAISNEALLQQMQEMQKSVDTGASAATSSERADEQFGNVFSKLINEVDQSQKEADVSIKQLATGDNSTSIQDVVFKLEQADVSFNMMKAIRDKLLDAYKEVMTMQS